MAQTKTQAARRSSRPNGSQAARTGGNGQRTSKPRAAAIPARSAVAAKARVPLLAGGAALAGALGGFALSQAAGKRPKFKLRSRDLASAAKDIGAFGEQIGKLAIEMRERREASATDRHRSPIEVVLQGLTARR